MTQTPPIWGSSENTSKSNTQRDDKTHYRSEANGMTNCTERKNFQPRILYSVRLTFRIEGAIKSFPDK